MRLFIAIDVSKEVNDHLKKVQKNLDARLTKSFHITLKYIGEANPKEIIGKLDELKFQKFSLTLDKIGAFPDEKLIRVVWVGIEHNDSLLQLQQQIESKLEIKNKNNFHAHITLARANKKISFNQIKDIEIKKLTFDVEKIILYKSELSKEGPLYKVIYLKNF